MLKAVVSDLNAVDEGLRSFYEPKDGKFVLKVESAEGFGLENVVGLKAALDAERVAHRQAQAALKPFEGMDLASVRTAVDRATAFGDLDPVAVKTTMASFERLSKLDPEKEAEKLAEEKIKNSKTQLINIFEGEKNKLNADLVEARAKLSKQDEQLQKLLKSHTITAELVKLDPIDEARDVLELIAAQAVKLQDVGGEMRPVVVDPATGMPRTRIGDASSGFASIPLTVADLMSEVREQRPALFKPKNPVAGLGTGGTQPPRTAASGDFNPWAKGSVNVTQQVLLTARDPNRAARLKAEAGVA